MRNGSLRFSERPPLRNARSRLKRAEVGGLEQNVVQMILCDPALIVYNKDLRLFEKGRVFFG